jgi:predicted PurR-regulated permease PerM
MGISFSSDFLFGVIMGGVLVVAGQPLLRSLSRFTRFLPLLLMVGVVIVALVFWLRG